MKREFPRRGLCLLGKHGQGTEVGGKEKGLELGRVNITFCSGGW